MRTPLLLCLGASLALSCAAAIAQTPSTSPARHSAPPGAPDQPWLGVNASWYSDLQRNLNSWGVKAIRLNWGWVEAGKPDGFAPRYADPNKLRPFVKDGFVLTCGLMPRGVDLNGKNLEDPDFEVWVSNYKNYCRQVMSRYGRKGDVLIQSYLVGNEPDINEVPSTGNLTPYQSVRLTKAMWEAKQEINPALQVESSPVSRPDVPYLREMIGLGVANWCDVIGIHAYSDQLDDARFRAPWDWLREVGAKKPVSISEAGVPLGTDWGPKNLTDVQWREKWHALAYLQAKRFGYDRMLLFTDTGGDSWVDKWAYRDIHKGLAPIQTAYDEVQFGLTKRPWTSSGFETPNDPRHEWIPIGPINSGPDPDWANFGTSDAHAGKAALQIPSAFVRRDVKRIAPDIKVGRRYRVSVWTKTTGTAEAILAVQGFNRTDGLDERAASVQGRSGWTKLQVSFVPTNPWCVVSLGAAPSSSGSALFDDVSIEQR